MEEIINLSINYQDFSKFHITPPRGILLYGPPGTGKTLLVKTVAKRLNLHLVVIDNSIFHGKYFGDAERMV
jgi:ATP-dependent 26S proteasome regulatory subunit